MLRPFPPTARRVSFWLLAASVLAVACLAAWELQTGNAVSAPLPTVAATRGDVVVSVGGVGRIVESRAETDIGVPSSSSASNAASGGAASSSGASTAPGDAVFPRVTGHIQRFLVVPGQRVKANQPIALVDDGGVSASAVSQAENDLATARLELRQKRTSDPLNGLPATPAELTAGRAAVISARSRLAFVLRSARPADVSAARSDIRRAEADYQTLLKGTPADRAAAIRIALDSITATTAKLKQTLSPPAAADVSAANADIAKAQSDLAALKQPPAAADVSAANADIAKAQADLAALQQSPSAADVSAANADIAKAQADLAALQQPPSAEAIAAAQQAVTAAKQKLATLTGPPDPLAVSAAQLDVRKAESDLAALSRLIDPPATPAELAAAQKAVDVANERLARLQGPPDPNEVNAAELEVSKATLELATLQKPPSAEAIAAATAAVEAAKDKKAKLFQQSAEAIAAATAAVQAAKDKKAKLLQRPAGAIAAATAAVRAAKDKKAKLFQHPREPIAAATAAVHAAKEKRAKLFRPTNADVRAQRLDIERAREELRILREGPSPTARAAALQAITAAKVKLKQLVGAPLPSDVTAARLDIRKAEADLAVLRARGAPARQIDVQLARLKVAAAQAKLASARFSEQLLTVRTPWSGTVRTLLTVAGAPVDGLTPVAAVADLDQLGVNVALSEFDAAEVKRGLSAVVKVDALGGKAFDGRVEFAALAGSDSGGVVTFPVEVSLAHSAGVKPGMNVSVRIIVAERRNVVTVPLEAVSRDGDDRAFVSVPSASGTPVRRRVTLGLANNKSVEIAHGLRAGEHVVVAESGGGEE
jgi:multidrug efflux pump subunit AcrA (membrane-fusion protein)